MLENVTIMNKNRDKVPSICSSERLVNQSFVQSFSRQTVNSSFASLMVFVGKKKNLEKRGAQHNC